jgi:hypothetical protein
MSHFTPGHRRIAGVALALAVTAGGGVVAAMAPTSAAPIGKPQALSRTTLGPNLISNSGFANGFVSWSRAKGNAGALDIARGGVWGSRQAVSMQVRKAAPAQLRDRRVSAPRSVLGTQYQASAWVRATGRPIRGQFELLEWKHDEVRERQGDSFVATSGRWRRVTFVTRATTDDGAMQLSVTARGVGGGNGLKVDRVRLHPVKGSTPTPTPTPTEEPTVDPTPTPEPTAPTPTPTPTQTSGGVDTKFGASVYQGSRTWGDALADSHQAYGGMEVVRVFYPGLPSGWPGRAGEVGGDIVVSFKAPPTEVLSGKHDALFANWFNNAPRDREIWWAYFHEPEDDVEAGHFTAQQWRDAYRRIAGFANAANNPRLHNTVILMCWTVNPRSGRDVNNYFPGADVVETMGWDCYNSAADSGGFLKPEDMYSKAVAASREFGVGYGIAETGSKLPANDPDGTRRAEWLGTIGQWLEQNDAEFVTYFDSIVGGEFRLLDSKSRTAWHDVVTRIGSHDPI